MMIGMNEITSSKSRIYRMGLSKVALVGALITITASSNAVMPLMAQQELSERLGGIQNYQLFLEAVTLVSVPFLLTSPLLLKGYRNKRVCQIGFLFIGLINFILYATDLAWHPLILRCAIGISYGFTIPMGQFIISEADLEKKDRVTQFTMMLNLIAAGLCIIPFIAISLLWIGHGNSKYIFLFLSIGAWIVAIISEKIISNKLRIYAFSLSSIKLEFKQKLTAVGDIFTIIVTRSSYALVLVWLSEIIHDFNKLQIICLFFTLPFVGWGFIAIPWVKKITAKLSFVLFLLVPLIALSVGLATGVTNILPIVLILVSLLSIPEAFTPGQLVSQWPSAPGRQFGNLLTMMLMTVCLSIGPMVLGWVTWLAQNLPVANFQQDTQRSIWLLILTLPILIGPIQILWNRHVVRQLKQ